MSELDLTEREEQMARIDPGYDKLCVTSRLDTFVAGNDFKFLEYNAETPAGVGDQMQLETVLEEFPRSENFLPTTNTGDQNRIKNCLISFYNLPRIRRQKRKTEYCHC